MRILEKNINHGGAKSTEKNRTLLFSVSFAPLWFFRFRLTLFPDSQGPIENYSSNTILKQNTVEVEQQPNFPASQSQLAQEFSLMNGLNSKRCLRLDDNTLIHQQSDLIRYRQGSTFVAQRRGQLRWNGTPRE